MLIGFECCLTMMISHLKFCDVLFVHVCGNADCCVMQMLMCIVGYCEILCHGVSPGTVFVCVM